MSGRGIWIWTKLLETSPGHGSAHTHTHIHTHEQHASSTCTTQAPTISNTQPQPINYTDYYLTRLDLHSKLNLDLDLDLDLEPEYAICNFNTASFSGFDLNLGGRRTILCTNTRSVLF
jgi:hypothetical protein